MFGREMTQASSEGIYSSDIHHVNSTKQGMVERKKEE